MQFFIGNPIFVQYAYGSFVRYFRFRKILTYLVSRFRIECELINLLYGKDKILL